MRHLQLARHQMSDFLTISYRCMRIPYTFYYIKWQHICQGMERRRWRGNGMNKGIFTTSVLELLSPVVGAVFALHAEVDVGPDAAVIQRLDGANVVAHAQEDLRRLVLAQQPQGMHLRWQGEKRSLLKVVQRITEMWFWSSALLGGSAGVKDSLQGDMFHRQNKSKRLTCMRVR